VEPPPAHRRSHVLAAGYSAAELRVLRTGELVAPAHRTDRRETAQMSHRVCGVPEGCAVGQNAASGTAIRELSADSMTVRSAVRRGSTVLAKKRATATLPW